MKHYFFAICFLVSGFLVTHARALEEEGSPRIPEIIVITSEDLDKLNSGVGQTRVPILKFRTNPHNSNYVSVSLCEVSPNQSISGGHCKTLNNLNEFYDLEGLRYVEDEYEFRRKGFALLRNITIQVITLPIGGLVFNGLKAALLQGVTLSVGAAAAIRASFFAIGVVAETIVAMKLESSTRETRRVLPAINCNPQVQDCSRLQALAIVDDKMNLKKTFGILEKQIPRMTSESQCKGDKCRLKLRSNDCRGCFKFRFIDRVEDLLKKYPQYRGRDFLN